MGQFMASKTAHKKRPLKMPLRGHFLKNAPKNATHFCPQIIPKLFSMIRLNLGSLSWVLKIIRG